MKPSRTPNCEHANRHTKPSNGGVHITRATMPELCAQVFASPAEFVAHHAPGQVPTDSNNE